MEALSLEVPFTEDEVHVALGELNGDKAPRSDGFTAAFSQFGWDVVKWISWGCLEIFMSMGAL